MNGIDPGVIAQNVITYFGGAAGGYLGAAAVLLVIVLAFCHVVHARMAWITFALVVFAWTSAWAVRTLIGWA
jgi:hypothetical protein